MSEENVTEVVTTETDANSTEVETDTTPDVDREPPASIDSRFLYVDVAAQRAKQLRRGALPRLEELAPNPETGVRPPRNSKLERIAMREVDTQKIYYEVPDPKPSTEKTS
jgi:DNA-directed RNA polymerase subunit K/omega